MTDPVLLLARNGAVATLTLNRPGTKNALNVELVDALDRALREVVDDPTVRAVARL
jgi:enoyl-CoA hydratase/carnithine racemase